MAMWLLRLRTLLCGHSGVRREMIEKLLRILQAGVLGRVPLRAVSEPPVTSRPEPTLP